jgi:hypothetical protein
MEKQFKRVVSKRYTQHSEDFPHFSVSTRRYEVTAYYVKWGPFWCKIKERSVRVSEGRYDKIVESDGPVTPVPFGTSYAMNQNNRRYDPNGARYCKCPIKPKLKSSGIIPAFCPICGLIIDYNEDTRI